MKKAMTRIVAGALSAALVLSGVSVPQKSASAAAAKLSKSKVVLFVGGNATAKVKAKNVNRVTYKSKDTSVAKVNKTTGKITAKGAGSTKIVAKTDAGKFKCRVRVYKAIKTLTTDTKEVTLAPGETKTVGVTVKPAKANETMWKVATSNKSVAKKQKSNGSKGTFDIIGVAAGAAVISVSSTDGGSAPDATVRVNVVAPESAEDTGDVNTDAGEDETPVYTEADIPEDIANVPTQWGIEILSNPALTNETQEELYVFYASYDEEGNKVENPAIGWRVTNLVTDVADAAVRLETEDVRECGCLVVKAPEGSQFAQSDIVTVTGESMNSDVTVTANIVVGNVREVADVAFAGILETATDAEGNTVTTNIGENLPLGFETSGNTYRLAFNGVDQMGNTIVNGTEGYWDAANACGAGTYMCGDALTESDSWDSAVTPARIGALWEADGTETEPAHRFENGVVNGTYYDMFLINGTSVSQEGGTAVFVVSPNTYAPSYCFTYSVCEAYDIAALELVAPEGIIRDGDSNVAVTIRGVYKDGTVVEKMSYNDLASVFGEEIAEGITATCADDANPMRGTATYDPANARVLWTDYYTRDAAYTSAQALYRETCFDGIDRAITIDLAGVPAGVEVVTTDLVVKDPSRPTDVVDASNLAVGDAYKFLPWGTEGGAVICMVDQYGDYMTEADVEYFYKRAVEDGYKVTDGTGNASGNTWYAMLYTVAVADATNTYAAWWDTTAATGWMYGENGIWTPGNGEISTGASVTIGICQFTENPNISSESHTLNSGTGQACGSTATVTRGSSGDSSGNT